jgi:hypothetical protein
VVGEGGARVPLGLFVGVGLMLGGASVVTGGSVVTVGAFVVATGGVVTGAKVVGAGGTAGVVTGGVVTGAAVVAAGVTIGGEVVTIGGEVVATGATVAMIDCLDNRALECYFFFPAHLTSKGDAFRYQRIRKTMRCLTKDLRWLHPEMYSALSFACSQSIKFTYLTSRNFFCQS